MPSAGIWLDADDCERIRSNLSGLKYAITIEGRKPSEKQIQMLRDYVHFFGGDGCDIHPGNPMYWPDENDDYGLAPPDNPTKYPHTP